MLRFILSCVLLISIVLWWAEARFNYLYAIVDAMKKCCDWVKNQTKFKIDVCKWFLPILLIVGAIVYLYYPYFKDTLDFKDGAVVIRDYPKESQENELVSNQVTKNLDSEEKTNPIGDWGTFGDFIGGTLNPIIGFISILLLFATWKLTRRTLDFTKQELQNSNQLLISQQFDSLFFSVLQQLKDYEKILTEKNMKGESMLDQIYYDVFYKKMDYILSYKREILKQNESLNQYFICLFQLYKMINNIFEVETKNYLLQREETFSLEKKYSNILRSIVPMKLQQLLFLNISEEFELYEGYLNYYSFFKHMSFSRLDNNKGLNIDVIALAENLKKSYKEESKNFLMLSESIHYGKLTESTFFKLKENNNSVLNGFDLIRRKLKVFKRITVFYSNESRIYEMGYKYNYLFITFNESTVLFSKKDVFANSLEVDESCSSNMSYADIVYDLDGIKFEIDLIEYFIYIQQNEVVNVEKILEKNSQKISTVKFIKEMLLDQTHSFINVEKNPL